VLLKLDQLQTLLTSIQVLHILLIYINWIQIPKTLLHFFLHYLFIPQYKPLLLLWQWLRTSRHNLFFPIVGTFQLRTIEPFRISPALLIIPKLIENSCNSISIHFLYLLLLNLTVTLIILIVLLMSIWNMHIPHLLIIIAWMFIAIAQIFPEHHLEILIIHISYQTINIGQIIAHYLGNLLPIIPRPLRWTQPCFPHLHTIHIIILVLYLQLSSDKNLRLGQLFNHRLGRFHFYLLIHLFYIILLFIIFQLSLLLLLLLLIVRLLFVISFLYSLLYHHLVDSDRLDILVLYLEQVGQTFIADSFVEIYYFLWTCDIVQFLSIVLTPIDSKYFVLFLFHFLVLIVQLVLLQLDLIFNSSIIPEYFYTLYHN